MKTYLIDAYQNRIVDFDIKIDPHNNNEWRQIASAIGCTYITVGARLSDYLPWSGNPGTQDIIFVDDEGLLKPEVTRGFFFNNKLLAGNGLVVGGNAEGETAELEATQLEIAQAVEFLLPELHLSQATLKIHQPELRGFSLQ